MGLDDLELLRSELARLAQDILRHPELADIVQQGRDLHRLHLLRREAEALREADREFPDPVDMLVSVAVLGVDRHGQRGDHRVVQLVQLGEVFLLLVGLVRVEPIGVIDDVTERRQQQGGVEPPDLIDPVQRHGAGGAGEIAGRGPEEVLPPHLQQVQSLGPGDRGRRAQRVDQVVGPGREYDRGHEVRVGSIRAAAGRLERPAGRGRAQRVVGQVEHDPVRRDAEEIEAGDAVEADEAGAGDRARAVDRDGLGDAQAEQGKEGHGGAQAHPPPGNGQLHLHRAGEGAQGEQAAEQIPVALLMTAHGEAHGQRRRDGAGRDVVPQARR